jgi:hypothetical protein
MLSCGRVLYFLHDAISAFAYHFTQTRPSVAQRFRWLVGRIRYFELHFQFYDILLDEDINEKRSNQDHQGYLGMTIYYFDFKESLSHKCVP